jgi:type III secretion protein U
MANKETEEKSLPASEKKLRDARKNGQVSNSRDLSGAVSFIAVLGFFYFFRGWFYERFLELVHTVTQASVQPFDVLLGKAATLIFWLIFTIVGSVLTIMLVFLVLPAIIVMKGLVFSFEPVKPQFDQLSPVTGLKRIASLRNVIEFVKGLVKVVLLSALFVAIGIGWLNPLFQAPACGTDCLAPVLVSALTALGLTGALGFVLLGLADVPIQRWLFGRDMRMTRSEYKREQRDIEGDPMIRREFYRLRREAISMPRQGAKARPTLIIAGGGRALAVRFAKDETPMPIIVGKGDGSAASQLEQASRKANIPVVKDTKLVNTMFERSKLGQYVPSDFFSLIVPHLVRLNLV